MNTVVPQAWIIQEKKRREEERRKKEDENASVPVSLPRDLESDSEYPEQRAPTQDRPQKSTVIVIDI